MNAKHKQMKRQYLLLSLFLVVLTMATHAEQGHQISIQINNYDGTETYLAYHFGNRQYLRDTAYVNTENRFVFSGKEPLVAGMYLVVLDDDRNFEIILDSNQVFEVEVDANNLVGSANFRNSPDNVLFYEYIHFLGEKGRQRSALEQEFNHPGTSEARQLAIRQELAEMDDEVLNKQNEIIDSDPDALLSRIILAQRDPELPETPLLADGSMDREYMYQIYKKHFFDNIDFSDDRILQTPVYHGRLRIYFNNVLIQHPDSIIAEADRVLDKARANKEMFKYTLWFITNNAETSQSMGMDKVFVHLVENYYMTDEVDWIEEERRNRIINRAKDLTPLLIGNIAPDFEINDPEGNPISLHGIEADYLVLYFWDAECAFCKQATASLQQSYEQLSGLGAKIFAVNIENDKQKWLNNIATYDQDWIHGNDIHKRSDFLDVYNIFAIPQIFILDRDKKIVAKDIGAEHVFRFLNEHMRQKGN